MRARGRLVEPEEFGDIVLQRSADGELVRLRGRGPRRSWARRTTASLLRFNGRTGVGLGIFQLPTANALDVRDARDRGAGAAGQASSRPGSSTRPGTDTTLAVRASIHEVMTTLVEAIALVILVIFVFLHGWRSVLITALTLPVSLVGTFAFVKLFGFSINTLTLFGLTLATGLVVDDAIVVIENIERLMAEQKAVGPRRRRARACSEVAGAVVAISIVLVAVFVPVAFFPGTTGAIYRQFALTIAASVALSTFCALTLTPALSALLLKHAPGREVDRFPQARRRCSTGCAQLRPPARDPVRAPTGRGPRIRPAARSMPSSSAAGSPSAIGIRLLPSPHPSSRMRHRSTGAGCSP